MLLIFIFCVCVFIGWWQYDDRTCEDLEAAYLENKDQLSTLIAGNVYCIDFRVLHQFRYVLLLSIFLA